MINIAIKGHSTRGNEVIKTLEILGGKNIYNLNGDSSFAYYTIEGYDNAIKSGIYIFGDEPYTFFSIEEFKEKFPYKIGDRVRIPEYESEVRIDKMYWDGYEIQYEVYTDEVETYSAEELNQWNESNNKSKTKMNNTQESLLKKNSITISSLCYEDEVELNFNCEYELIERDGKHILIKKKPKYPKTYEECCKVLNYTYGQGITMRGVTEEEEELFRILIVLKRCRDAYWKIAGEELGLGKPWEPAMQDSIWGITRSKDEVEKYSCHYGKTYLLEFPTEEMRDAFYENFKDIIEECKEFL